MAPRERVGLRYGVHVGRRTCSRVFLKCRVRVRCPTGGHVVEYACVQPLARGGPGGNSPPSPPSTCGYCPTGGHVVEYACVQGPREIPPGGSPPVRRSRVFVNAGVRDGCPTGGHVLKYACVQPSRELSLQGTGPFGVRCGGDGPGGVYVGGRDPPVVFLKAGVRDGCPTGGHVLKYACVQVSSPHLVFLLPCRRPSVGVGDGARSWRFQVPAGGTHSESVPVLCSRVCNGCVQPQQGSPSSGDGSASVGTRWQVFPLP